MTVPSLAGYTGLTFLASSGDIATYRGAVAATSGRGRSVLVYTHEAALPTQHVRDALKRNVELLQFVHHPGIAPAVELVDRPSRVALVVAAPSGPSLADVDLRAMPLVDMLQCAIDVAPALAELHVHGVAHGGIDMGSLHVGVQHAQLACPWFGSVPTSPSADVAALARVIATALGRGGHRVPHGVDRVLEAATSSEPAPRYRSVVGFAHDLERCCADLRRDGLSTPFTLSLSGFGLSWRDPAQPVGQAGAVAALVDQLALAERDRPAVAVVRGEPGSGRSVLLHGVQRALREQGVVAPLVGFSAVGNMPLQAPNELARILVDDVVAGDQERRTAVVTRLRAALGADVDVAVALLPPLAKLLGPQRPPAESSALEMAARVERAARGVVTGVLEVVRPLAVLFDDADLADAESVTSLRVLAAVQSPVAVVLARRAEEVPGPLDDTLRWLRDHGVEVIDAAVPALDFDELHGIIAGGLGADPESVAPLASALARRSGGNPGLAIAELKALIAAEAVRVDPRTAMWSWDQRALATEASDGAEVAARRLSLLPPSSRALIVAVAIAGRVAHVEVVASAFDRSVEATADMLDRLVAEQLVEWRGRPAAVLTDEAIRQAALDALDPGERSQLATRLGRAALTRHSVDGLGRRSTVSDDERFVVAGLLDGGEHSLSHEELAALAEWCEEAARVAHRSGAYAAALDLQLRVIAMLGPVAWQTDGDRMFELHLRAAENALVVDRTPLVDQLIDTAWAHHPSALQRVRALRLLGNRWWTRQEQSSGLAEMHTLLGELGEPLPVKPGPAALAREYLATRRALGGRTPESFLSAPTLTDERSAAVLDTLLSGVHLAYTAEPFTHVAIVLRGLRVTAQRGVSPASAYFVAGYGLLTCGLGRHLDTGVRYGAVGTELAERYGGAVQTMVAFAHNGFVRHWGEPLEHTMEPLLREYRSGLAVGRGGYAHTAGTFAALHALLANRPLDEVRALATAMRAELDQLGERAFVQRLDIVLQAVADLADGLDGRPPLDGSHFSATNWLGAKPRKGELALIVHTLRAHVALAYGRFDDAASAVQDAAPMLRMAPGEAIVGVHQFQLALLDGLGVLRGGRRARRARALLRRAAERNPHDMAHRLMLAGGTANAGQAAELARRNHQLADLAVALRLLDDPAGARAALQAWGALGAERHLRTGG